eukprot:TRINITY_DN2348_c0_g1_i1.p1 TRINITY_DN2348_c0_g1~~TRINITY_DN2348_c0_g1_i1.p1  ORF type:complete len:124 (-),score=16.58 TRINITY_DN2348_c0_g1_i1:177-548(-)
MSTPDDLAKQFVMHYYQTFDTNRANLAGLYRPQSMLSFETNKFQGAEQIIKKLTTLQFTSVRHQIATLDAQPTFGNALLVFVSGVLQVEGESHQLPFSQVFTLAPEGSSFYVLNDMFRFNFAG